MPLDFFKLKILLVFTPRFFRVQEKHALRAAFLL